jgi:type I restriction enzyme S subunit
MGKYQGYDKYKDSGVEWLGEIPNHWEVVGLTKYLQSLVDYRGKTPEKTKDGIFLVTAKNIKNGIIDYSLSQEFVNEEEYDEIMRRGKPQIGDVLLTTEAPLGEVANVDDINIALAQRIIKMQGKSGILDNYFLKYWILGASFSQNLQSLCTGSTALGIKASKLCLLKVVIPPLDEQEKIAQFLDYKTKQIDELIAKKETLIEKLDEKRTSLISHAVTKGLDENVPMKDSGIEWLGEIPQHWESLKIKRLTVIKRGASPRPIDDPKYFDDDGEYAWVRIADVTASERYLETTTQKLSELGKSFSVPLEPGQLFLSIAGSVGKPIITKIKCCIHDGFVYFPDLKVNQEFIYYIFYSGQPYLGLGKMGTQLNLNTETVGGITIGFPPLQEQQKIAEYLDQKTAEIEEQKTKIKKAIDLLKEYRTALITNAVTGKIDVRQIDIP